MTYDIRSTLLQGLRNGPLNISWAHAMPAQEAMLRPLVLLHGIGSDARSWQAQLTSFGTRRQVIAWNAPGYAESAPFSMERPVVDDYADILSSLLDNNGIKQCDLVGHSLGALTAARMALRTPSRVANLILSAPASGLGLPPNSPFPPALQGRIDDITRLGPAGMAAQRARRTLSPQATAQQIAGAVAAMGRVSVSGYTQAVHLLATGNLIQDLRGLQRPVYIMTGREDVIVPMRAIQEITTAVPGCILRIMEQAGHASYYEYPETFNKVLEEFCKSPPA
ncbi:alpha/beta fold hydrolase [Novacetimonas hansenii]|uniref:alpha/beta fold hydrolase n=1 Tax=Novacetimonas hansenii TaxID=436 RepID=UPI00094F53D9|nr:alpha/beta fold hydrolase [Novacetimonas hansenii]